LERRREGKKRKRERRETSEKRKGRER